MNKLNRAPYLWAIALSATLAFPATIAYADDAAPVSSPVPVATVAPVTPPPSNAQKSSPRGRKHRRVKINKPAPTPVPNTAPGN